MRVGSGQGGCDVGRLGSSFTRPLETVVGMHIPIRPVNTKAPGCEVAYGFKHAQVTTLRARQPTTVVGLAPGVHKTGGGDSVFLLGPYARGSGRNPLVGCLTVPGLAEEAGAQDRDSQAKTSQLSNRIV